MSLEEKESLLLSCLREIGPAAVAFSGGVDSSLLLAAAAKALPGKTTAVLVKPPYFPERELDTAREVARRLGISLALIGMDFPESLRNNPEDRCYLCKGLIFSKIIDFSRRENRGSVLDGSNTSDMQVHRPGRKALEELKVRSPLGECGFSKEDVRSLAKKWKLPVWNKPAYPCLLTRFPHRTAVDEQMLDRADRAEQYFISEGFPVVRVRIHGDLARIEIPEPEFSRFCKSERLRRIRSYMGNLGYGFVTMDLGGYRSGSMDPAPTGEERNE